MIAPSVPELENERRDAAPRPGKTGAVASKSARCPKSPWERVTIMARGGCVVANTPTSRPPSLSCP